MKLLKLKEQKHILGIPSTSNPYELHPDMPTPSDDLEVIVSGGFNTCCTLQLFN